MPGSLTVLRAALDVASAPVTFFLRNDDAGWDDARLLALLDLTADAGVPIDLAVIPQATSPRLALTLCARIDAAPALLGVHQHGHAHVNHETTQRKCEFGDARSSAEQRADLAAGRAQLRKLFGERLDPIFTPPWNRCSATTPNLLVELGFAVLSRSRGAPAQQALAELPIDVDWCKLRRLAAPRCEDGLEQIELELARRVDLGGPVGLMLHHADMDAADLLLLRHLLDCTLSHPRAQWQLMRNLVAGSVGSNALAAQRS